MTMEELLAMEPGLKLDILVAEKIFNAKVRDDSYADYWFEEGEPMTFSMEGFETRFKPSTDISAAWEIVEKLSPRIMVLNRRHADVWHCKFYGNGFVEAETAPHAICLAALLEVMEL